MWLQSAVPAFKKQTLSIWMSSAWSQGRKPTEKITTTNVGSLKKISKIDKHVARMTKRKERERERRLKLLTSTMNISTNITEIKRIAREH